MAEVGSGAWSTAYRFACGGRDLVIRIGPHVQDFDADRRVALHRSVLLPIPEVLHVGAFRDEYCCVSTFVPGTPLEACSAVEWSDVVPSLADALEAMRACGAAEKSTPWNVTLRSVDASHEHTRLSGWREKIARSTDAVDALAASVSQLRSLDESIDLGRVESTLTHGDLINRNVHVEHGAVAGIFDWGCMRWGDHLYDLAWFDFWSSWYPELDIGLLRQELDGRWDDAGYSVAHRVERERACLLHIGADHLIYNAVTDSAAGLDEVIGRMAELDLL